MLFPTPVSIIGVAFWTVSRCQARGQNARFALARTSYRCTERPLGPQVGVLFFGLSLDFLVRMPYLALMFMRRKIRKRRSTLKVMQPIKKREEVLASAEDLDTLAKAICDQADRKAGIKRPPRLRK